MSMNASVITESLSAKALSVGLPIAYAAAGVAVVLAGRSFARTKLTSVLCDKMFLTTDKMRTAQAAMFQDGTPYRRETIHLKSRDILDALYVPVDGAKKLVIFYPGLGGSYERANDKTDLVAHYVQMLPQLFQERVAILIPNPRGVTENPEDRKKFDFQNMPGDAVEVLDHVKKLGFQETDVITAGQSFGGMLAVGVAAEIERRNPHFKAAVLLDRTSNSFAKIMESNMGFAGKALTYVLNVNVSCADKLKNLKGKVLALCPTNDPTIKYEFSIAPFMKSLKSDRYRIIDTTVEKVEQEGLSHHTRFYSQQEIGMIRENVQKHLLPEPDDEKRA